MGRDRMFVKLAPHRVCDLESTSCFPFQDLLRPYRESMESHRNGGAEGGLNISPKGWDITAQGAKRLAFQCLLLVNALSAKDILTTFNG